MTCNETTSTPHIPVKLQITWQKIIYEQHNCQKHSLCSVCIHLKHLQDNCLSSHKRRIVLYLKKALAKFTHTATLAEAQSILEKSSRGLCFEIVKE